MSKWVSLLFFLASLFHTAAQDSISLKGIEGTWKELYVKVDETGIPSEALPVRDTEGPLIKTYSSDKHWVIRSNKLSIIAWPCSRYEQHTVELSGINLRFIPTDSTSWSEVYTLSFSHDTLLAKSLFPGSSTHYFVRDQLPAAQLNELLAGKINPQCLYGDWEIPVGEVSVPYDSIVVGYPFKLPAELHIKASNLHWYWANERFYLKVDGVKRPFKVNSVSATDENMWLIPEKWINKYKDPNSEFEQSEGYYSVWLRRISEE